MNCEVFVIDGVNIPGVVSVTPTHRVLEDKSRTVSGSLRSDVAAVKWEGVVVLENLSGIERLSVINQVQAYLGVRTVESPEFTGNAMVRIQNDAPYWGVKARGDWSRGNLTLSVEQI